MNAKKIIFSITIVLALLFVFLIQPEKVDNSEIVQLSRIDFQEDIDSIEASQIRNYLHTLPGIQTSYFNLKDNILVYTYKIDKQNSTEVFNSIMSLKSYKASRFVVPAAMAESGCPIQKSKNLISKISNLF